MKKPQRTTLDNGLVIVTENMPEVRSVSLGIWVRVGSRHEKAEFNGISHFIEHMVFKGTHKRTQEEIARSVDSIGGHLDAFTAKEFICFSTKVLDEHLPLAFDVLADMVGDPIFGKGDIQRERRVVQEEIKMVEDTPDDLVHEIFTKSYWRNHSLGRPILGTRRSVGGFSQATLFKHFRRNYAPNGLLVTAAGHLEHDRVVDLVARTFSKQKAAAVPTNGSKPVPHPDITYRIKRELEQVHICLGTPAYPVVHDKRYVCYILSTILGGGMSSRLFQNIREKQGLVYAVFSFLNSYRDSGNLAIYAGTAPANARKVVQLITRELGDLKEKSVSEEEIRRAKDHLKGSLMLGLESTGSRMSNLARQEMYFSRFTFLDEILRHIERVTVEDVQQVSREIFQAEKIALTVLGPSNGGRMTRRSLEC